MKETGPYILIARLGEGGMAEVFKAIKKGPAGFEKPIALKRILPHLADNDSFIRMLSTEARIATHLDHPNLVQVLDFFAYEGTYLMALEYVAGRNLRRVITDANAHKIPLSWPAAVHIMAEVLNGLDFAHRRKGPQGPLHIVHRDVSPQNVLLSYDGLVKLSDFGIARANIEREETDSGVIKGKQRYLSPEQLKSSKVDHRSDLFSVGVVLYELICNLHPFESTTDFETMNKIARGEYRPSSELRPEVPTLIHQVINEALTVDLDRRIADAAQFRSRLLSAQDPAWLSHGTGKIRDFMAALYPEATEREDVPIEKTPLLDRKSTSFPSKVYVTHSLIPESSIRPPKKKGPHPLLWIGLSLAATFAGISLFSFRSPPPLPKPQPRPIVANVEKAALVAVPTAEPIAVVPRAAPATPGTLVVKGPDGAKVFLNGRLLGRLPIKSRELSPGTYVVLVAPTGAERSLTRVAIRSGKVATVRWNLSKSTPESP